MTVYFMQPTDGGIVKIGHALNVDGRQVQLGKLFPYGVELMCAMPGDVADEYFLHHCFAPLRLRRSVRGEWYRNSLPIWQFIADVEANGRPSWLSTARPPASEVRETAIAEFGGRAAALEACGYSPATGFDDVFHTTSLRGQGNARLQFTLAKRDGLLPGYIANLHVNTAHKNNSVEA